MSIGFIVAVFIPHTETVRAPNVLEDSGSRTDTACEMCDYLNL